MVIIPYSELQGTQSCKVGICNPEMSSEIIDVGDWTCLVNSENFKMVGNKRATNSQLGCFWPTNEKKQKLTSWTMETYIAT